MGKEIKTSLLWPAAENVFRETIPDINQAWHDSCGSGNINNVEGYG